MKLDILAFGAHPDDVELGCGATIAKEISLGKSVGIIDLTRGELGTRGSAKLRDHEAENAAKILKVSVRENLNFADGFFINDKKHQLEVIKMIRKYQPDIILCNAVEDRHIDHPKGSSLVSDACFLSGLMKIETDIAGIQQEKWRPKQVDIAGIQQEKWRPKQVYHYIQWKNSSPDFVVDVSGFLDLKTKAVLAYSSQFFDPNSKEPETPITSKNFIDSIHYRAKDLGRLIGVDAAEGFTTERYVAVENLSKLI